MSAPQETTVAEETTKTMEEEVVPPTKEESTETAPTTEVTSEVKPVAEPVVETKESAPPAAVEATVSEPAVTTTTTDAAPSAVTRPEESQEVKAAAASAAPVTPEKPKASFVSTLKRGLNVALNPKPGLDGSNGKSKLALKSKANDTINLAATRPESSTPAEQETKTADAVANKENTSSSPEPAAKSEETTPSKSRAFANLRRRMSEGFSSPLVPAKDKKDDGKKEEPKDEPTAATTVAEPVEAATAASPAVDATESKSEAPPTPSAKDKGTLRVDTAITDKAAKVEAKAEASFRKIMDKSAERVDKLAHSATDQVTKAAQGLVHSIEAAAQKAEGFLRKSGETRQTGSSSKKNSTAAGTTSDSTAAPVVVAATTNAEATPTNTSEKTSQQFIGNVKKFFGTKTPEGTPSKKKPTTGSSSYTPAATEDGAAPAQVLEVPAEPTPAPQTAAPPSSPNPPVNTTTSKAKKRESIFGTLTQAGRKVSDFVKEEMEKKHEKENAAALASAKETKKTEDVPTSPAAAVTGEESQSKTETPAEGNGTVTTPAPDATKQPEEVATDATSVSKDEKEAIKDEDVKKKSSLEGWALLLKDKVSGGSSKSKE